MKSNVLISMLVFLCGHVIYAQEAAKPATVQQIKDAIDWTKVPKLDGATKLQTFFNHITYKAPGTFKQAADFYLEQLAKLGWQQEKSVPTGDQKDYLSVLFDKGGMLLSLSGYRSDPKENLMTVTLMVFGNVDVSKFPKLDDAQVKSNYKTAAFYLSKKSPEEAMAFMRKFMKEQGWTEKPEDNYALWAKDGRHVLKFQQNAMDCTMVAVKKPEGTEVMYSSMVQHDLSSEDVTSTITGKDQAKPATLKEAMDVINIMKLPRMEKATKGKLDKELSVLPIGTHYEVPDSVDNAVSFYRKLLKEHGFTELTPVMEMDDHSLLRFEKQGFLFGFSANRDKKENVTKIGLINYGNVDLRKLPFPLGAKFDPGRSSHINTDTTLNVDEAFAFYRKELAKLGWKEDPQPGQGTTRFTQNGIELRLEIGLDTYNKTSIKLMTGMK